MFTAAFFTIAKRRKQLKRSSTDEWINKTWYRHTMEYYSALIKKEGNLTHAAMWMKLEGIRLREK